MILWLLACTDAPAPPADRPRKVQQSDDDDPDALPRGRRYKRKRVKDHELLRSIGYLDGTEPPSRDAGVQIPQPDRVSPGNNLYVSGHGPEAHLIDPQGKVLHEWRKPFFEALPDAGWDKKKPFPDHWRRALLLEDGSLFVIWGGQGMARLDKDSNVVWAIEEPIHHDLELTPDGQLWTLSRRVERVRGLRNIMDEIVRVDPDTGAIVERHDVATLIANGPYAPLVHRYPSDGDLFHTNTIEWLDGPSPFEKGRFLVSFRHLDTIAVVDLKQEKLVWALTGQWSAQHQPTLLDDGDILLFDNNGTPGKSRVLKVDPFTQAITWSYGSDPGQAFHSRILGSVQRLPNGNTLITESDSGHAFEVTDAGERVWSFTVPYTAGPNDEFVASLYELVRLPPDFAFP